MRAATTTKSENPRRILSIAERTVTDICFVAFCLSDDHFRPLAGGPAGVSVIDRRPTTNDHTASRSAQLSKSSVGDRHFSATHAATGTGSASSTVTCRALRTALFSTCLFVCPTPIHYPVLSHLIDYSHCRCLPCLSLSSLAAPYSIIRALSPVSIQTQRTQRERLRLDRNRALGRAAADAGLSRQSARN